MGGEVCSDFVPVSLPAGTNIWTRIAVFAASGYPFVGFGQNTNVSEGCTAATTRVSDLTRRFGSPDPGPRSVATYPIGIIARTTHGGVLGIGDSILQGTGDSYAAPDGTSDGNGFGLVGRAVSGTHAYINAGQAGDALTIVTRSNERRLSLARYVRNIVFEHGVNDINDTELSTIKALMVKLWLRGAGAARTGSRLFQTTITPETGSTDGWATLENQTALPGFSITGDGKREQLNSWLRDGAPIVDGAPAAIGTGGARRAGDGAHPLHAVFDVADAVESARNSGKWKVNGTAGWLTTDGIHPTRAANLLVAASGAINTALFA
ncbi:SGNH/GDSL hydrolase family protein [Ancylobacter sp. Lp-2]|uniref:SGNH/GDSL hydrolase family protein n=1 Tax=Ancylobacter sp. Lp-2 TaxID=2881339 RepID=UPI001E61C03C|nr:SGNH/GDSL hydrolase family protein [Ancylobacter sp. Lp-2]MCB4768908.1 SGNH/GDSL hydrolase family protein [Ancylobacter sp. Lp-2]